MSATLTKAETENKESSKAIELLDFEIFRNEDCQLKIKIKSQQSKFFKMFADDSGKTFTLGGVKCFRPKVNNVQGVSCYFAAENSFEYENMPNFAMLLATDIEDGVEFDFGSFPITESKMENWRDCLSEQARILYLAHGKPVGYKAVITTETIDKEIHN